MALNIYLFRHAQTPYNANNDVLVGGRSNFLELSVPKGIEQAQLLGKRLKAEKIKFDRVYSSPAIRTIKTANIVCDIINFPKDKIVLVDDLMELSQGDWEGLDKVQAYTPAVLSQMTEKHWEFKAPNGESQKMVEERMYQWVEKQLITSDQNIAVFGHGIAIKCLIRKIMNSDPRLTYRISIDNCSITQFKYNHAGQHKGWSLIKVNDTGHLV